jgi:hypothetical protein
MAGSKLKRPLPGFSPFRKPSRALSGGAPLTGGNPSGFILEDTAGNAWYLWFDTNGVLRFTDAVTAETAGFNFNTGGSIAGIETFTVGLLASAVDTDIWVAPQAAIVVGFRESHSVVGGASAAVRPRKITDTSAPGAVASGTVKELTTANIDLTATINTVVSPALSATVADLTFAVGNRLALDFSGTLTNLVGQLTVSVALIG